MGVSDQHSDSKHAPWTCHSSVDMHSSSAQEFQVGSAILERAQAGPLLGVTCTQAMER